MHYIILSTLLFVLPSIGAVSEKSCPLGASPSAVNYALVQKIARDKSSLSGFIGALPESLRTRFVLAYRSESLQYASAVSPRVILFNEDVTLLLAYSGAEDHQRHGVGTAEIIAFNSARCDWEFHQFRFSKILEDDPAPSRPTEFDGAMPCASCHQGRPIWDTYSLWPGFFGSYDDGMKIGTPEATFYEKFIREGSDKVLYQPLLGLGDLTPHEDLVRFNIDRIFQRPGFEALPPRPYYLLHEYTEKKTEIFHYEDGSSASADYPNGPRPLEKLSVELTKLNSARIAKKLVSSGLSKRQLLSILAALIGCRNFEKIFSGDQKVDAGLMEVLETRVASRGQEYYDNKLRRMKDALPMTEKREKHFEGKASLVQMKARLLLVLESAQMNMDDWSLTRQRNSLSFFHSNYSIDMMVPYLASYFDESALQGLGFPYSRAYENSYCGAIEEISLSLDRQ